MAPTLEIREASRLSFGRALVASLSIFHHCSGFHSFAADFCSHPTKSVIAKLATASLVGSSAGRWSFGRSKKYLVPVAQAAHLSLNLYFIRFFFFNYFFLSKGRKRRRLVADQVYWFLLGRPWTASVKAFVTSAISGHPKGMWDWARAQLAVSFKNSDGTWLRGAPFTHKTRLPFPGANQRLDDSTKLHDLSLINAMGA